MIIQFGADSATLETLHRIATARGSTPEIIAGDFLRDLAATYYDSRAEIEGRAHPGAGLAADWLKVTDRRIYTPYFVDWLERRGQLPAALSATREMLQAAEELIDRGGEAAAKVERAREKIRALYERWRTEDRRLDIPLAECISFLRQAAEARKQYGE